MRIVFVCPAPNMSGGARVVAIYAKLLKRLGHSVQVIACLPRLRGWRRLFAPSPDPAATTPSHFNDPDIDLQLVRSSAGLTNSLAPDADAVIATWWETAEWVARLANSKGAKYYFVQHHEIHSGLPEKRSRETYRLPLHKIVVAQWLADVMASTYGDIDVDVVPNSVDHHQFHASERGKRRVPTAGLLYSTIGWKRFGLALSALRKVRERLPALSVVCFGAEPPPTDLPSYVRFHHSPAQDMLRDLYAQCDVWLTASSTEGFNLPAMEAMACRTPVVATRTGWPAEAIVSGVNGACVEVEDEAALAIAVETILRLPESDWKAMSANAYETVRTLSWDRSARLFERALLRRLS